MRVLVMPGEAGRSEKPIPGSEGTTTSKASAALAPCAAGSASSGMILVISTKLLGQP
jgi:hypothetical protein